MRNLLPILALTALISWGLVSSSAQDRKILSPRDSIVLRLDTSTIAVTYSRPSMRGRVIMGELVPWNRVWRTGANQATHLRTDFDMRLGSVPVPAGTYTLWTLPSRTGWKIILNKQTGQWGTQYDERLDLARFEAESRMLPSPVDTFTVVLESTGRTTGVMKLLWERTMVTTPYEKVAHLGPLSPPDSSTIRFGGRRLTVRYSRPWMRGRTIWGVVVPFDTVWRTGANFATTLDLSRDVKIGGTRLRRGVYTLYTIPSEHSCTLIISSARGGAPPVYQPEFDVLRLPMERSIPRTPVDPFRIWFESSGRNSVLLKLGWADRVHAIRIQVP